MKGISPVIATVLLLLMAVAAVGGAWVWYHRQSGVVATKAEERIGEQIEQTGIAISLSGIYKDSGNYLHIIISNAGANDVNVSNVVISDSTTQYFSLNCTVPKKWTVDCNTTKKYTQFCTQANEKLKIKLFVGGISTQEFIEYCPT